MVNKILVPISNELADKINKKIENTNFDSISDYIIFLLEQLDSEREININSKEEDLDNKKEEEEIKKSLKELGYL